ncbi:GPI mannosyltransferase 4 isoform X4 [Vulpes lagopus]|uniref:GPI mannosyltransferase 4 isoform X4 n=1 Tax=Vulpes lagopus TaxID=494514 RepID=UPI001BCA36AD|nr:GPI mannosyltransferase 4 isoform X4 [Vulpes lagopus]
MSKDAVQMQVCGTRTASEATEKPLEAPGTGSRPQLDLKMALRVLWGSLGLLRLVWCLLPQTGYVHPDEFFQSPEVMAEDILGVEAARPWEFQAASSCRSPLLPLLTSGCAFWLLRLWGRWGLGPGAASGYALLVGPRLLLTGLSFGLDLAVYHLAPRWGAERWRALVLLAGSYVTLVFYTRTFSNAIEGLFFAGLLVLVSPRVAWSPAPRQPAPGPRWCGWLLGGVVAAGFFNRPTFLAFALVPLFLWSICSATSPGFKSPMKEALVLLPGATLVAAVFVAVDSWYFSSPSRASALVLTPANFLYYNLDPQNLARHGTHMRLTHLAVNGFLLFGMLHAWALQAAWQQLQASLQAFAQAGFLRAPGGWGLLSSPRPCLLLLYFTPLALLSAFSHQEARFLIPLLVPLVLLCSPQTQPVPCKGTLVLFNVLGALLFGCLHQGGLVPGLGHLEQVVHAPALPSRPTHYTLLFTHTYMPPRHLLHLPGLGSSVEVVDMGGTEDWVLCRALNNLTRQPACQVAGGPWLCRLFVVTPGTTRPATEKCHFPLKSETLLFPHLTLEDPPALSSLLSGAWRDHLSLHILELGAKPDNVTEKPLAKIQP